jgi:hypothetical protein
MLATSKRPLDTATWVVECDFKFWLSTTLESQKLHIGSSKALNYQLQNTILAGPKDRILAAPKDRILAGPKDHIMAGPKGEIVQPIKARHG